MPKKMPRGIRESWFSRCQKKRREQYFSQQKKPKGGLKRTALKPQSAKQRKRLAEYMPIRNKFLEENPFCVCCKQLDGYIVRSTEVHHKLGRVGPLLTDTAHFVPVCSTHGAWVHANPYEAAQRGWMPEACLTLGKLFKKAV
jgi:hypothetical protein